MALNAQIALSLVSHETSTQNISSEIRVTPASYSLALATGTGANQAQVVWSGSRTIGASEIDDLVLSSLTDDRGTIAFTAIKAWYVKNTSQSELSLGRDQAGDALPSSPWAGWAYSATSGLDLSPNGAVFVCNPSAAGSAVASGSRARVSGPNGSTYQIVFIGEGTIS